MSNLVSIDATKARSTFFSVLNNVFENDSLVYEIKKSGIPVAYISKKPLTPPKNIMKFAGSWSDMTNTEAEKLIDEIYENRDDTSKVKRTLPKI